MTDEPPDQPTLPRQRFSLPPASTYVVTVVSDAGAAAGQRVEIDENRPSPCLVGKSEACDLRLEDPSVSRRHASMEVVGDSLRLRDLGSTNGSWIEAVSIVEVFLRGTVHVRLGSSVLRVDRGALVAAAAIGSANRFGSVLGGSHVMRRLHPLCARLAASSVPVVIEGETGVGKEQLAESLHRMGPRHAGPFVVFDCTAVAPSLIESELFGHERGAFTGSVGEHAGVFERAHQGTLLIDEIGDMPLDLQPKLLRAIERLSITRVGGRAQRQVDVRVLAATRRDLDREVQVGRFRDDLFHRLAVARIELPPLRERRGDVELLGRHFWVEMGGDPADLSEELLRSWDGYAWPGNVRELRNAVARRLALGDLELAPEQPPAPDDGEAAHARAVHGVVRQGDAVGAVLALDLPLNEARQRIVDELEQRYVLRLLELHGGNMARAAAAAGVARRHFRRLKAKFLQADMQADDGEDDDG